MIKIKFFRLFYVFFSILYQTNFYSAFGLLDSFLCILIFGKIIIRGRLQGEHFKALRALIVLYYEVPTVLYYALYRLYSTTRCTVCTVLEACRTVLDAYCTVVRAELHVRRSVVHAVLIVLYCTVRVLIVQYYAHACSVLHRAERSWSLLRGRSSPQLFILKKTLRYLHISIQELLRVRRKSVRV